jgi:hypothetical protein
LNVSWFWKPPGQSGEDRSPEKHGLSRSLMVGPGQNDAGKPQALQVWRTRSKGRIEVTKLWMTRLCWYRKSRYGYLGTFRGPLGQVCQHDSYINGAICGLIDAA